MNINTIIKQCQKQHGISVTTDDNTLCMNYSNGSDSGSMTFIPALPGITIAVIKINSPDWPAPDLTDTPAAEGNSPFVINYCIEGRCELLLNNNNYVYVADNQISLSQNYAMNSYIYPGHLYYGIEVFIDLPAIDTQCAFLSQQLGIDLSLLASRYCGDFNTYISYASDSISDKFRLMWRLLDNDKPVASAQIKTLLLSIFAGLLTPATIEKPSVCTFYTSSQVAIAKDAERIMTSDLSTHHTAKELASRYSISETSLKNYFRGVFGKNISDYMYDMRMQKAALLLASTTISVLKAGEQVGYHNQSKFAAAFKKKYGMSPLQYRHVISSRL